MNKYKKHLWTTFVLNIGLALILPELCHIAYIQRGNEWHFGGEWLLPWAVVIATSAMLFNNN